MSAIQEAHPDAGWLIVSEDESGVRLLHAYFCDRGHGRAFCEALDAFFKERGHAREFFVLPCSFSQGASIPLPESRSVETLEQLRALIHGEFMRVVLSNRQATAEDN